MAKRRTTSSSRGGTTNGTGKTTGGGSVRGSRPTRSGPGDDRLTAQVLNVCDSVGEFIDWWGFKGITGRIWALLAMRREPLTQVEIAETLGVSRSLVSTAVAQMTELGLIAPESEHRNAPYRANLDIWPVVTDVLRSREWMMMEQTRVALESAIEEQQVAEREAGGGDDATPYDIERMKLILQMTENAQNLLRVLMAMRMPSAMAGWLGTASSLIGRLQNFGRKPKDPGPPGGA
jgi:DNA-binding transcriptional regulator GbsR (MarR family)